MPQELKVINCGGVNCYLVKTATGYILIDTGVPNKRIEIEKELATASCQPGSLALIVLTHGDYDHAGNAAYLREKYGAKVAMHKDDSMRVERGDWKLGFKAKPDKFPLIFKIVSFFIRPGKFDTFKPDIYVEGGSLLEYDFEAQVLHLPGHTRGSIGILTKDGSLFCGDLMDNFRKPGLQFFIDDMAATRVSVEKLKKLNVKIVYPWHGKPFPMERFTQ
ncbi:MAG: MBL fold metallo-hydrolase [Dehalococcoidales bacterium]|nr:MBL fold metallo-hydrolase [Dehalococcoidales bacterium]